MAGTLCFFGTYDAAIPRTERLKAAWEARSGRVIEVHADLWPPAGVRAALRPSPGLVLRYFAAQWRLFAGRSRLAEADAILVPYPGHLDMRLAAGLGRAFGKPVVFDPFISLFDTAVGDRGRYREGGWEAAVFRQLDLQALRAADHVLADTSAQADYYAALAGIGRSRLSLVPVGADEKLFVPRTSPDTGEVLFYGSMIPLHGVEVIVEAARRLPEVRFHLVGEGQVDVKRLIAGLDNVRHTPHLAYEELPEAIAGASVCLGIFGTSEKAGRVVPHKVYEAAAMGQAIVTADTPAMREAFGEAVAMVPAGDAAALAAALQALLADATRRETLGQAARQRFEAAFSTGAIGQALELAIGRARASLP